MPGKLCINEHGAVATVENQVIESTDKIVLRGWPASMARTVLVDCGLG